MAMLKDFFMINHVHTLYECLPVSTIIDYLFPKLFITCQEHPDGVIYHGKKASNFNTYPAFQV